MKKIFFIILLPVFVGCYSKPAPESKETAVKTADGNLVTLTDAQLKNSNIELGKATMQNMESLLKVNGLIDVPPQNMVTISFPSGGYLKSTKLIPGMKIRKGQVLAVMEDQSFIQLQQDYLMAQNKLTFLEKEFERQKLLNSTKATSDKVYEQTASDFQSAKILQKALFQKLLLLGIAPDKLTENNISRIVNIYSPINGFVTAVKINIGKYVSPSDVLFELTNPDDLHLMLTVFEKDLSHIQPGQNIKAYLINDTAKIYGAKVMLVSHSLDSNRSGMVHCHFTGNTNTLLPGMYMSADIAISNAKSLTVPESAVVRFGEQEYIFVQQKNNQFKMIPVKTTHSQSGLVALKDADNDFLNQVIITKNAYYALMKMKNTGED